jgi:hypothetical protein
LNGGKTTLGVGLGAAIGTITGASQSAGGGGKKSSSYWPTEDGAVDEAGGSDA